MAFGHDPQKVADYMLWNAKQNSDPITPMQLLKLVYIAHGWTLGLLGKPLINEHVEAWQYGPVVPSVYHEYKNFRSDPVSRCPAYKPDEFTARERNILDQVWKNYGHMSGLALSSLTHQRGTPWDITIRRKGRGSVISNDLIEDHYQRLAAERS